METDKETCAQDVTERVDFNGNCFSSFRWFFQDYLICIVHKRLVEWIVILYKPLSLGTVLSRRFRDCFSLHHSLILQRFTVLRSIVLMYLYLFIFHHFIRLYQLYNSRCNDRFIAFLRILYIRYPRCYQFILEHCGTGLILYNFEIVRHFLRTYYDLLVLSHAYMQLYCVKIKEYVYTTKPLPDISDKSLSFSQNNTEP